ncbi:MAG TPA: hypothetical protein VKB47_17295 [Terracidiphilus sp.]|nr:hypothetical protein [Terracidiphilus sp.]
MKFLKNWFDKGFSEEPKQKQVRPERRAVPGLEAIHWTGSSPGLDIVKNISSTGMYLVTRERWPQGEVHPIRLVYEEMTDDSPATHVTVEAKSVRWGEDGMGLAFLLPEAMDLWLWKTDGLVEPEDILSEFRLARALAFLTRICPQATHDLKLLFREGLSNIRIAQAIRILNRTEAMLAAEPDFHRLHAPESVVLRVVKEGSWAEDPTTQQLWAGILSTACTTMGDDESNMPYMDLLSEFANIDGRLFTEACTKTEKVFASSGAVSAVPIICTGQDLIRISGAHDLMKIDRNLFQLANLGLLEPRIKNKYFNFDQDANLTPTALGLELFARGQGHRGAPHDYYSALISKNTPGKEPSPET